VPVKRFRKSISILRRCEQKFAAYFFGPPCVRQVRQRATHTTLAVAFNVWNVCAVEGVRTALWTLVVILTLVRRLDQCTGVAARRRRLWVVVRPTQTYTHAVIPSTFNWLRVSFSFLTDRLRLLFNPLVKASCVSRITNYQLKGIRNCPVNDNHRLPNWRLSAI